MNERLADTPLATRDQVRDAMLALYLPLVGCASPGGARYEIEPHASTADPVAAALEGFARPLWGLAAAAAGGYEIPTRDLILRGLTHGSDPTHGEYWGRPADRDQRLVEASTIASALLIAPDALWWPLSPAARGDLTTWLTAARDAAHFDNNWLGMRALTDLALDRLAGRGDAAARAGWRDRIEAFHLGEGWYRDGMTRRTDHYGGFGIHFDALLLALFDRSDAHRADRTRQRASAFASQFAHWFADDGAALPFGRSLSYRFGCAAFWGALAYAGVEALPWGEIKGYWLRHIRWWLQRPMARRDDILTLGHAYPNAAFAEDYLSPGSAFWAFRAFLPLALPQSHAFWRAREMSPQRSSGPITLPAAGMLVSHRPGQTIALATGQQNPHIRDGAEKYAKFAYSTRHGFCVEAYPRRADWSAVDNMIGFTVDGRDLRVRTGCADAQVGDNLLRSRWHPMADMTVDTWLWWAGDWHYRLHQIVAPTAMTAIEGGFAIARPDDSTPAVLTARRAQIRSGDDVSAIVDLGPLARRARIHQVAPNSSLIHPRALVPQLVGALPPGKTVLAAAIYAGTGNPPAGPAMPTASVLERILGAQLGPIAVHDLPAA